jgi:hypothetical protein
MKLKYLREVLGYLPSYCCNEYSCCPSVGTDENEDTQEACLSTSKYSVAFDFISISNGFSNNISTIIEELADDDARSDLEN